MKVVAKYYGAKNDEKYYVVEAVNEEEFQQDIGRIKEQVEEKDREEESKNKRLC